MFSWSVSNNPTGDSGADKRPNHPTAASSNTAVAVLECDIDLVIVPGSISFLLLVLWLLPFSVRYGSAREDESHFGFFSILRQGAGFGPEKGTRLVLGKTALNCCELIYPRDFFCLGHVRMSPAEALWTEINRPFHKYWKLSTRRYYIFLKTATPMTSKCQ